MKMINKVIISKPLDIWISSKSIIETKQSI